MLVGWGRSQPSGRRPLGLLLSREEASATFAGTAAEWGECGLSDRLGTPPPWPPASSVRQCGWPGARRQLFRTDHLEAMAKDDTMLRREHVRDIVGCQNQQACALSACADDEMAAAAMIAADFFDDSECAV